MKVKWIKNTEWKPTNTHTHTHTHTYGECNSINMERKGHLRTIALQLSLKGFIQLQLSRKKKYLKKLLSIE